MSILFRYLKWYALFYIGVYVFLFVLIHVIPSLPQTSVLSSAQWHMQFGRLEAFSVCWVAIMFAIYITLSIGKKISPREVFLHMGVIAFLGPLCEVLTNAFCRAVFGTSLWVYDIFPVHGGDTSKYSFCVWAIYGCHLYFMDKKFIHSSAAYRSVLFALILSVDAVVLEFLLNLSSIYYFHSYVFYYFPSDIRHLTTIAVVPFYFFGGLIAAYVIQRCYRQPVLTGVIGLFLGYIFVFVI